MGAAQEDISGRESVGQVVSRLGKKVHLPNIIQSSMRWAPQKAFSPTYKLR